MYGTLLCQQPRQMVFRCEDEENRQTLAPTAACCVTSLKEIIVQSDHPHPHRDRSNQDCLLVFLHI